MWSCNSVPLHHHNYWWGVCSVGVYIVCLSCYLKMIQIYSIYCRYSILFNVLIFIYWLLYYHIIIIAFIIHFFFTFHSFQAVFPWLKSAADKRHSCRYNVIRHVFRYLVHLQPICGSHKAAPHELHVLLPRYKSPLISRGVTPVCCVWPFAPTQGVRQCSGGTSSQSPGIRAAGVIVLTSARGVRLEIKPNKNVWFVAFIFGRCQLQFKLALCPEAGWVTNMKDALMNCWQSTVSSPFHYMMAMKTCTQPRIIYSSVDNRE